MKQHPDSVNRDLEDEVADVIEHQYARKLMKPAAKGAEKRDDATTGRTQASVEEKSGGDGFETDMQELREKSGF